MEKVTLKKVAVAAVSVVFLLAGAMGLSGCGTGEPSHESAAGDSSSKKQFVWLHSDSHICLLHMSGRNMFLKDMTSKLFRWIIPTMKRMRFFLAMSISL